MNRLAFNARRLWDILLAMAALGIAVIAYFQLFGTRAMQAVMEWTALSAAVPLRLLGTGVDINGTVVASDRFAYVIIAECTLIGPLLLYLAAVLAYPTGLASKAYGVGLGLLVLGALNVVRLVSLFYVGTHVPQYLDVAHLIIWQGVMVLSVVVLWLSWVQRSGRVRAA